MRILCTGDVHIGRRSTRLPAAVDAPEHSTAEAWTRIVDAAVAEKVDVVAISGDLIDRANRFFEAVGGLERGLARLVEAGIAAVMVAGNHDYDVLPALAARFESSQVRLLGRNGEWERLTLERNGARLHVDGWSFPRSHHLSSPLGGYDPPYDGAPVLALIHADLDQPASRYAPVTLAELRRHPHVFYLLGHVHTTLSLTEPGGARLLYPGAPQALDPGEPGSHGIHIVELASDRLASRYIPISTVRYETVEVDMGGVGSEEEVDGRISAEIARRLAEVEADDDALRHLRCRVRLVGPTRFHHRLDDRIGSRAADLDIGGDETRASVEAVEIATRPDVDLAAIAGGQGPTAVLARLLLEFHHGTLKREGAELLQRATRAAREMRQAKPYMEVVESPGPSPAEQEASVKAELERAAGQLLVEMLAQKELTS